MKSVAFGMLALLAVVGLVAVCYAADEPANPATQAAPATPATPATPAEPATPAAPAKDIVDTATDAGNFKTLVTALAAADLLATLHGEGPFTIFAPTDEAFAKLPAGTLENLLKPENKAKLRALLTHHVVPGNVSCADATKLSQAKTIEGTAAPLKTEDGKLMFDKAKVTSADIKCKNGTIHVIDAVIIPTP